MVASGEATDAAGFFAICDRLRKDGAHNIQILSPTVHLPALRVLLKVLKGTAFPLPIILKSSGFESVAELRKLEGLVDIYLPDLKFGSCSAWAVRAGVRNYFFVAREAIEEMIRQTGNLSTNEQGIALKGVLVRHVEAPLPAAEKREILDYLDSLKGRAAVFLNSHFTNLE
jgi:putative pyruvate formate lyase activating enzyme